MKVDNIAEGQDKPDAICDVCLIGLIADRMANRRIKKDTGRA